ncbi:Transporter [Aphelenchoides fujianensis]|nr:Transporter [Aphelenchoides fujianensis]
MAEAPIERAQWDLTFSILMTCLCYSVGLGNIWRFPCLGFFVMQRFEEHGGGAFLLPYLFCSFIIGFPILFLEMSLASTLKWGPLLAYGRIRPAFQGSV